MLTLAQDAAAAAPGWQAYLIQYSPLLIMFAILYFLLIRPQQKRQKTRNAMLNSLKKNDKVVTIGGLHGTVVELSDDTVVIRVNDATKMTFDRSAISSVTSSESDK
jgi:preprotein translocase subunit YajC